MKSSEFICETIEGIHNHQYLKQIPQLVWQKIDKNTWESIQDEGLDEEQEVYSPGDWIMSKLTLSTEDINGLKTFNHNTIEDCNRFDIGLKEMFPNYVDLIDYDNGTITIVKTKVA